MYMLSFCQLLGKSFEIVILMQVGGKTLVVAVLGGEMVVYLLYKVIRGDWRYFLNLPAAGSFFASVILRVTVKVIHDFTGFLHARHPYEMGGFYWMLNMAMTQGSVFAAIFLKSEFGWRDVNGDQATIFYLIRDEDYIKIASVLLVLWLIAIFSLILASEKDFR